MKAGRKGALILALVLAVVTGLTSVPAAIAAERVVLVDFSWSSVQVHDRIAASYWSTATVFHRSTSSPSRCPASRGSSRVMWI